MMAARRKSISRIPPLPRRWPRWLALLVLLLMALRGLDWLLPPASPQQLPPGEYTVERVVDGDTLLLVGGARVRLIGADTPETVRPNHPVEPFGPEATAFTRRLIEQHGRRIRIELDGPSKDRHGRFLAVVWVDDRMLNEELLRRGLARLRDEFRYSPPLKHRLRAARDAAKDANRGLHGPLPPPSG
jgi:micrococcal nuclease